jgi:pyrrolidone-carboxylate peptidase
MQDNQDNRADHISSLVQKYPFYGIIGEKKVLVTGSGWYKHIPSGCNNNSQIVAESLHGLNIEGTEVVSSILPNMWDSSVGYINEAIKKIQPILMISIGTDDVIDIRLEKYASNLAYGLDYSNPQKMKGRKIGNKKEYEKILEKAPDLYEAILPDGLSVSELVNELLCEGIPACAGDKIMQDSKQWMSTAGYYLCNYFAYMSLHFIHTYQLPTKYLFIHIPTQPRYRAISLLKKKETTPAMELHLAIKGIKIVIQNILQYMKY